MPLAGIAPMTTPLGESFYVHFTWSYGVIWKNEPCSIGSSVHNSEKLKGVADVNVLGGLARTFEVTPNLDALASRGLSLIS